MTCGSNSSNRTLFEKYAFFNPSVTIRNVTKWRFLNLQKHDGIKNVTNGGSGGATQLALHYISREEQKL